MYNSSRTLFCFFVDESEIDVKDNFDKRVINDIQQKHVVSTDFMSTIHDQHFEIFSKNIHHFFVNEKQIFDALCIANELYFDVSTFTIQNAQHDLNENVFTQFFSFDLFFHVSNILILKKAIEIF